MPRAKPKPKRAPKKAALLEYVKSTAPPPGTPLPSGFRCRVCQDQEMVEAVQGVVDLRRSGQPTIGIQALANKLSEVFGGIPVTYSGLKHHLGAHVKGGWNG